MKNICVFCGSSSGGDVTYSVAAQKLGKVIAAEGMNLVYGGGNVGLMGEIAGTVMQYNGEVYGVIPEDLMAREIPMLEITDLRIVKSMHERKAGMAELADAFIAMPGGIGTFEEFFEIWTWAQLGIHKKPIGILNINNYYNYLIKFLDHSVSEGFLKPEYRSIVVIEDDPLTLIMKLKDHPPPDVVKWLDKSET